MSATTPVGETQGTDTTPNASPLRNPGSRGERNRRRAVVPGWWAIPGVAVVLALIYVPTAMGSFYAFTDWKGIGGWNWVGLANFKAVLDDEELRGSLKNTVLLAFG